MTHLATPQPQKKKITPDADLSPLSPLVGTSTWAKAGEEELFVDLIPIAAALFSLVITILFHSYKEWKFWITSPALKLQSAVSPPISSR